MAVSMPSSFSAEDARTDDLAAFRRRERARREAHAPKATGARLAIARPEMTRARHVFSQSEGVDESIGCGTGDDLSVKRKRNDTFVERIGNRSLNPYPRRCNKRLTRRTNPFPPRA